MKSIIRKELADIFGSARFIILICLILMLSLLISFMAGLNIETALENSSFNLVDEKIFLKLFTERSLFFSFDNFITFFGPLIGIILGFDSINRERNQGTLSKILSQPIFRDEVILGKYLAGLITIALIIISLLILIAALAFITIGLPLSQDELLRLLAFALISIIYIGFWLSLAILFSIFFRNIATSALASLAAWIFMSFFVGILANMMVSSLYPNISSQNQDIPKIMLAQKAGMAVSMISPVYLYAEATDILLDPTRRSIHSFFIAMSEHEQHSYQYFKNPLPLSQSLILAAPYLILLLAFTFFVFWISYLKFLKQEIRSI